MTHEVFNQVPPLVGHDLADDPALLDGLAREGAGWAAEELHELGRLAGTFEAQEHGRLANEHPPVLRTHDRYGHRIDEVEFHPSWHYLMDTAVSYGLHGRPWSDPRPGAHVARAAKFYTWRVDAGHGCPISMTYASIAALRLQPDLAALYEPLLTSETYDFGLRAPLGKAGLLAGMSMTEKQGGSDVRANTTRATPQADGTYRLVGHKWFTSAPMCDVFLTLAQAPGGLTCFLVPRVLPDGSRNPLHLMRLKDKLGNKSNASSEIEYHSAHAWRVGDEGRGVRTIIEMVNLTRLDCLIGAAAGMRQGVTVAAHHAAHRQTFGRTLHDHPLMQNVLADLAIESEAATTLMLRLAGATDRNETSFKRLGIAVGKYFVTKRWPGHSAEALECLGGNGYVEDSGMPRLFRESPLNSVWEGSGNVAALDSLRAIVKYPHTLDAFFEEVELARGSDPRLDKAIQDARNAFLDPATLEFRARRVAEQLTLTLQASLLVRHGHPAVADAFCASRLTPDRGSVYGTLPSGLDLKPIIERATPTIS